MISFLSAGAYKYATSIAEHMLNVHEEACLVNVYFPVGVNPCYNQRHQKKGVRFCDEHEENGFLDTPPNNCSNRSNDRSNNRGIAWISTYFCDPAENICPVHVLPPLYFVCCMVIRPCPLLFSSPSPPLVGGGLGEERGKCPLLP